VGAEDRLDPVSAEMAGSALGRAPDLPGPSLLGFVACAALVRTEAFAQVGGFDTVVRFPGEEERVALDLATAGWGLAYVDEVTIHHHPSPRRSSPGRRQAAIWRSRLLTAVMRLPARDVARLAGQALTGDRRSREGLLRALTDVPAALRRRQTVPPSLRTQLRLLAGETG
jgi:GT2 family glycosyltransferase